MKKNLFFFGLIIVSLITLTLQYGHAVTDYSISRTSKLIKELTREEIIDAIVNENLNRIKNFKSVNANAKLGDYTLQLKYSSIDIKNATPLALALESDQLNNAKEIIKALLHEDQDADLFQEYSTKIGARENKKKPITLLTGSLISDYHYEIACWLVRNKRVNDAVDEENNTALHKMATSDKCLQGFKKLMQDEANIEAINNRGETPLHCALKLDVNKKLITPAISLNIIRDSTIDLTKIHTYPDHYDKKKTETLFETILELPQSVHHYNLLKLAVQKIIDANKAASPITASDDSLFHILANNYTLYNDFKDKVEFNQANSNLRNHNRETPLFTACKSSDTNALEIVKQLIAYGALKTITDLNNNNLLHAAAKAENLDILKLLLKDDMISALINNKNTSKQTPLDIIIKKVIQTNSPWQDPFPDLIKLLIENGADKGNAVDTINEQFKNANQNAKNLIKNKLTNLIKTTQPLRELPIKPSPAKKGGTDYSIERRSKLTKPDKIEPKSEEAVSELQQKLNNLSGKLSELKEKLKILATQLITLKSALKS